MEPLIADRLATMFHQFPLGLALLEKNGEVYFVNDTLTAMTGTEAFELIGQGFYDVLFPLPDVNTRLRQKTMSALEAPFDDLDLTIVKGKDEKVSLHISGGKVREGSAEFLVLVVQDVTSMKAFEKVIESSFDNFIQVTNALDAATKKLNEQNSILEEYKEKMTKELGIAKSVQKAIIPVKFPRIPGFQMSGVSIPSDELGGDYFDYFLLDDEHIGILIADVSGHGVPSSLITTMVKAYFEYYTKRFLEADKVLANVNHDISAIITDTGFYLTALYMVLDLKTHHLSVSVAGHDSALCWHEGSGTLTRLGEGGEGTILGVFPDAKYNSISYQLQPGSKVILFTDGITEARSQAGEFYGNARLEAFLKTQGKAASSLTVEHLIRDINAFYGSAAPNDDRTLLVFDLSDNLVTTAKDLFQQKDFEGCLQTLEKVLAQGEESAELRSLAGRAAAHLGRDAMAAEHLEAACRLDARSPSHPYYLGLVLHNLGQADQARLSWEKVLELQSDYKDTRSLLARSKPSQEG